MCARACECVSTVRIPSISEMQESVLHSHAAVCLMRIHTHMLQADSLIGAAIWDAASRKIGDLRVMVSNDKVALRCGCACCMPGSGTVGSLFGCKLSILHLVSHTHTTG